VCLSDDAFLLLRTFQCNFGECLGGYIDPLVVHLEIILKSVHLFRCCGNIHISVHCKGLAARHEMLVSACTCSIVGLNRFFNINSNCI